MPKSSNTQYSEKIEKAYDELQFLALLAEEKMTPKQKNQHKDAIAYTEFVLANGMTGEAGEFRGISVKNDLMEKTKANIQLRDALEESGIDVNKYVDRYMQKYESSKKNNHGYERHGSVESDGSKQSRQSEQSNNSRGSNGSGVSMHYNESGRRVPNTMKVFKNLHNNRLGGLINGVSAPGNNKNYQNENTNFQDRENSRRAANQNTKQSHTK